MSMMFADGFDHYGADSAAMLDGEYAELNGITLSTVNPRTGARAMRVQPIVNNSGARRVLPGDRTVVGLGYAFNLSNLPTDSRSLALVQFLGADNTRIATLSVMPTGALLYRNGGWEGPVVAQSAPVIRSGSYQHFEIEARFLESGPSVEVRINGVTVLSAVGLEITAAVPCAQVVIAGAYGYPKTGATQMTVDVDDLFAWDDQGTTNIDFLGDKKAYTRFPATDGPDQDWTISIGDQSWPMLDNVPPLDGSEYLTASSSGQRTSVGIAAFPAEIVSIAGVYVATRLWKNDAGNARVAVQLQSGAEETDQPVHPISMAPTWYGDVFELDPNTSAPFVVAGLNASRFVLEREE